MSGANECALTLRSSGLAPANLLWPSFHSGPKPACLREPLNSNVRLLRAASMQGKRSLVSAAPVVAQSRVRGCNSRSSPSSSANTLSRMAKRCSLLAQLIGAPVRSTAARASLQGQFVVGASHRRAAPRGQSVSGLAVRRLQRVSGRKASYAASFGLALSPKHGVSASPEALCICLALGLNQVASVSAAARCSAASQPSIRAFTAQARTAPRAKPNPSFKRTRSGKPALAFISFWAKAGLPTRAA